MKERISLIEKEQGEALIQADLAAKTVEKSLKTTIAELQKQIEAKEAAMHLHKAAIEGEQEDAQLHKTLFQESQKEVRQWQERFKETEKAVKEGAVQVKELSEQCEGLEKECEREKKMHMETKKELLETQEEKGKLERLIEEQTQRLGALGMVANAAEKIATAVSNLELSLSCLNCMGIVRQPVALTPCGHIVCSQCVPAQCSECKSPVSGTVTLTSLGENTIPKLGFLQQHVQFLSKVTK